MTRRLSEYFAGRIRKRAAALPPDRRAKYLRLLDWGYLAWMWLSGVHVLLCAGLAIWTARSPLDLRSRLAYSAFFVVFGICFAVVNRFFAAMRRLVVRESSQNP